MYYWTNDHHCNMVETFVNVFKKVFDTLNIGEHLDVNMCIKRLGKVGVMGHHPSVVVRKAIWSFLKHSTIVSSTVDRVTVFALCSLFEKSLRIMFVTYIVNHAGCIGVFLAARSVQQTFCDHLKKKCILWKRNLRRHQVIYVFDCGNFLLWRKDKKQTDVK
jgi:hypothetical protein